MRRREFTKTLIGSAGAGSSLAHPQRIPAQNARAVPRIGRTLSEALAGITPHDTAYAPGDVRRYGADPTGTVDSTAAINRALRSNRYVYALFGIFKISASSAQSGLIMAANQVFEGFDNATLSINADEVWAITASAVSSICVRGWTIVGNGSTTTGGFRAGRGINFDGVSDFVIQNLKISGLGNMNPSPANDAHNGGFGICVVNNAAESRNGLIADCTITQIAGGGVSRGDGILICKWAGSPTLSDITIRNCSVSTCGRDCYSISTSTGMPTAIHLLNCYGEKSSAAGLDIEDGERCTVEDCHFFKCGNDQTFFDPVAQFGTTYRLLAGLATGNLDIDIIWRKCRVEGCYYGMTYGATSRLTIEDCEVQNSTIADITMGLAAGAKEMRIINSRFLTPVDCMGYYSTVSDVGLLVRNCTFAGRVTLPTVKGARFIGNSFSKSLQFSGGPGSRDVILERNTFSNWPGPGVDLSGANIAVTDLQLIDNVFHGDGDLTYGIQIGFNSALRLVARGNVFAGVASAGIGISNGGGRPVLANVESNTFAHGGGGILCAAHGIRDGVIDSNRFIGLTGWCIDFEAIGAGYDLDGMKITNNIAEVGVQNGLRIAVTTGAFDNTTLTGNDFHSCSGIKWSVAAGNPHGRSADNII